MVSWDYLAEPRGSSRKFHLNIKFGAQSWLSQIKIYDKHKYFPSLHRVQLYCKEILEMRPWKFFPKAILKNRIFLWTTIIIKTKSVNALQRTKAQPTIKLFYLTFVRFVSLFIPSKHKTSIYRRSTKFSKASYPPIHWDWQNSFSSCAFYPSLFWKRTDITLLSSKVVVINRKKNKHL